MSYRPKEVCVLACFEKFIKERKFLHNVSPRTLEWYAQSFNWLEKYPLTEAGFKDCVMAMRQAGLKPTSCNNRIRVFNAYAKWANLGIKIDRLKETNEVLPTFSAEQVKRIVDWKAIGRQLQRENGNRFVFATLDGMNRLGRRVILRDFKAVCREAVQPSLFLTPSHHQSRIQKYADPRKGAASKHDVLIG